MPEGAKKLTVISTLNPEDAGNFPDVFLKYGDNQEIYPDEENNKYISPEELIINNPTADEYEVWISGVGNKITYSIEYEIEM